MYKLYIPEPVLTTGNHIEAVKALGTIKQQLEEYRQYNELAARRLQWLTDLLVERFDPTSEVMKKFKKWNKKVLVIPLMLLEWLYRSIMIRLAMRIF